jgi:hypothetical protein
MTTLRNIRIPALLATFAVLATVACQAPAPPAAEEAPDYAAELSPAFDAYIEVFNTQDYSKLEGVFAQNFRRVAPDQNVNGPDEMAAFIRQVHETYPDFEIVLGERLFGENLSFNQWTATGTITLEDGTEATIETPGLTMVRYVDGMIAEEWVYYDTAAMMEQLGMATIPHVE